MVFDKSNRKVTSTLGQPKISSDTAKLLPIENYHSRIYLSKEPKGKNGPGKGMVVETLAKPAGRSRFRFLASTQRLCVMISICNPIPANDTKRQIPGKPV